MPARASIIVLAWNGEKYLAPCLRAVLAQTDETVEVFVVDNASTDDSAAIAQNFAPRVRLIQNEINLGFAGGNNVGIKAASGAVVILLNQDTVVQPGWLAAILETFTDPSIGIVGCKALYPDGKTIQHAGAFLEQPGAYPRHYGQGELDLGQYDAMREVDYVTGAAFAIRREVLERMGFFDASYDPAFYEEVDYCYRAHRGGFHILYQPRATIYHYESASFQQDHNLHVLAVHRNRVRFVLCHWSAEQLERFWAAEQAKLDAIRDAPLLEILAQAYFENALALPSIILRRNTDASLGGKLRLGSQHHTLTWLYQLSNQAGAQVLQAVYGQSPNRETATFEPTVDEPNSTRPWSEWLAPLPNQGFFTESPAPPSRIRVLGPAITWLRGLWFTIMLRPALAPVLGRIVLSLEFLYDQNQSLHRHNQSLHQQNHSLQRQMAGRDIALSKLLHSILEHRGLG